MTLEPLVRVDSLTAGAQVAGMPAASALDVERVQNACPMVQSSAWVLGILKRKRRSALFDGLSWAGARALRSPQLPLDDYGYRAIYITMII